MVLLRWEIRAGDSVAAGRRRIVPLSRSLAITLPGKQAGLIWNRPHSLTITEEDGSEHSIPVRGRRRHSRLLLPGMMLCLFLIFMRMKGPGG